MIIWLIYTRPTPVKVSLVCDKETYFIKKNNIYIQIFIKNT